MEEVPAGTFAKPDLSKAPSAVRLVRGALGSFSTGRLWVRRTPLGELEARIPVLYKGDAVDVIMVDPEADEVLPKGLPSHAKKADVSLDRVEELGASVIRELKTLDGAEYRGPESCWAVPLAYRGLRVLFVRVDHEATRILPDYAITEEMGMFQGRL